MHCYIDEDLFGYDVHHTLVRADVTLTFSGKLLL